MNISRSLIGVAIVGPLLGLTLHVSAMLAAAGICLAASVVSGQDADFYGVSRRDQSLHRITLGPVASEPVGHIAPLAPGADLSELVHAGHGLAYCVERSANLLLTVRLRDGHVIASVPLDQDVWVTRRGFDVAPDGTLWGVLPGLELRTIDPHTGHTTLIAPIRGVTIIEAIAFSPEGTLYAVGDEGIARSRRLYTLDTATGATTWRADLPVDDVDTLTWADGFLYGADSGGFTADLYRIDPVSGALDVLGDTGIIELNGLLAASDSCYADCDGDGSLDFFDFLCFQRLFAAGDPKADCDASGELDFFDFLCFQNAFAAGCP